MCTNLFDYYTVVSYQSNNYCIYLPISLLRCLLLVFLTQNKMNKDTGVNKLCLTYGTCTVLLTVLYY